MNGREFHKCGCTQRNCPLTQLLLQSLRACLVSWKMKLHACIKLSVDTAIADCFLTTVALHSHLKGQDDASQALSHGISLGLIAFKWACAWH